MPPFVLTVLKVLFLLLLYFFVYRAIRSVVVDLRAAGRGGGRPDARSSTARTAPIGRTTPPSAARAPTKLVVIDGKGSKVDSRPLNGPLQVGRADACHVKLDDNYASQFHARLFGKDGSWYVEDLGSTNGTYLNQRRVTSPVEVRAGDRVKIGKTVLELRP